MSLLLLVAMVGCGVLAGVFFAFSAFVVRALVELPGSDGANAMRSINRVIVRTSFLPLFFGTAIAALVSAVWSLSRGEDRSVLVSAAAALYVFGAVATTIVGNVPLNNRLESSAGDAEAWRRYVRAWSAWNHVRTLASAGACACFGWALRVP